MARFMIEIPHSDEYSACVRALHALDTCGSHFITHADFGCADGVHTGWLIVDVENRAEAQGIVPVEFRAAARIVRLQRFTRDDIAGRVRNLKP